MYKLLIIDDEINTENRESIYKFMLEPTFSLICSDSSEDKLKDILSKNYFDCVVLDNNLNNNLDKDEVLKLLATYNYPVIMVSNVKEFSVKEFKKEGVIDCISLNMYFSIKDIPDDDIKSQVLKDLHSRIIHDICINRNYSDLKNNDELVICHLSDIQFCDPDIDENAIRTLFSRLEEFVISRDKDIDLMVITGDIVFSGKHKEFKEAKESISKFIDKIKRRTMRILDIMFVPGNHDFDYQCYMVAENENRCNINPDKSKKIISFYKEKFADNIEEGKTFELLRSKKITPSFFIDFEAEPIYLNNFKNFAYDITKDSNYLFENLCIENSKYLNRGFKFVGVNDAYKYHSNIDKTKRYMFELDSDLVNDVKPPIYSIVMGHIDPRSLGYNTICNAMEDRCNDNLYRNVCSNNGQCEKWADMQRLFRRVNGVIYLSGHKHYSDIEISSDKKTLFIGAASPTGANPSEKTINIIHIKNIDSTIDVKISVHRAKAESIAFQISYCYKFDKNTESWSKI